ncbi:amidohydrolase [Kitasatospora sp. NPDC059571]|uniref:amidohydrolase n=1 Tax=Kitasatospora sp. NPDC059571 TaxID=3346871 RepID=UPI0036B2A8B8
MATADTLVTGALVRTLDPARPLASALAVTDGVITAVGEEQELKELRGPSTAVHHLAGATVTPGLTDGHTHPLMGVDLATGLDLSGCRDLAALRAVLAEAARTAPRGGWVTGWNLDHNTFGDHPIDRSAIDDVLGGVPAFLRLYDAHSALVSGAALAIAGIDGPRRFAQRAEVVCDADGRPTGHLVEHAAIDLVVPYVPAPPAAERRSRLLDLLRGMAATGLTTGHVMDLQSPDALELLAGAEDGADLPVRLLIHPWCMPGDGDEGVDRLVALQGRAGRGWRVAGVKFFIDGTVEGGTAWLEHPDCHGQGTEAFWPDPAEYARALHRLDAAGVATATHAIGDAGVRHVLDTVEALGVRRARHRIEHIETVPDAQLPRFAALGVAASMQPGHCAYTRADHGDAWSRRLGPERADRAWRCRDLRDAGATLVLGSDWPISGYDARAVLAAARLRRPARAPEVAPVRPEQALTALMALEGCTTHAARAAGEEAVAGRIAVGMRADLTAFALDPLAAPADEVAAAPIRLTMTGGRVVHREE